MTDERSINELKVALQNAKDERDDFHREMMDLRQQLVEAKR